MQKLTDVVPALAARASELRVAVIGDLMVDENIDGPVTRISPEAPVLILSRDRRRVLPGGAANVAAGIVALGAHCTLIGMVGPDQAAAELAHHFKATYGDLLVPSFVVDTSRPTTVKTRFWARGHGQVQQLFRVDSELASPCSDAVRQELLHHVRAMRARPDPQGYDAIIISDYMKGVITRDIVAAAVSSGIPVIAAPKPSNSGIFQGVQVVFPNMMEASAIARGMGHTGADPVAILKILQAAFALGTFLPDVVITLGKDGIMALGKDGNIHHVPTQAREVFDVTGAGDTALAMFSICYAAGLHLRDTIMIANAAAGVKVGKVGVATVSFDELLR